MHTSRHPTNYIITRRRQGSQLVGFTCHKYILYIFRVLSIGKWVDSEGVRGGGSRGGRGTLWGCSRILLSHLHKIMIYFWVPQLELVWLAPLLGDLMKGGVLGAWPQKCMECPQVGRGGVFRQVTSNWFQTCSSRMVLCISCMNEVKKCFGKSFGWICALNRWSVQERAHIIFCPTTLQVLNYPARELCRQAAA